MDQTLTAQALAPVCIGRSVDVLEAINQSGVELAAWQREPDPAWADWLESLPLDAWPACRLDLAPQDAVATLDASFDACGTPRGVSRDAFAADVASLAALFAGLAQAPRVRMRLDTGALGT